MKKLGPVGMKSLKIFHLFLVVLFLGGILCSLALNWGLDLSSFAEVNTTYKNLITISDHIVRYGAQGTILVGLIYGLATNWGFFRHKWVAVKWAIFMIQTIIGIFVVDKLMVANMKLLETEGAKALTNPMFIENHYLQNKVVVIQIVLTLILIIVSVIKPWKRKIKSDLV